MTTGVKGMASAYFCGVEWCAILGEDPLLGDVDVGHDALQWSCDSGEKFPLYRIVKMLKV